MNVKQQILLAICMLLTLSIQAQELTVKSFQVAVGDISASVNVRNDLNGKPCALVRVMLKDSAPKFQGSVLGNIKQEGMQYYVFMPAGTKRLRIVPADHFPLMVEFADYGIVSLEGKITYDLVLIDADSPLSDESDSSPSKIVRQTSYEATETITVKGVSFKMVRIDGGSFSMGVNPSEDKYAWTREGPSHQVTLSTYAIGETEVTQALWEVIMGKNPSRFVSPDNPVEMVSWIDCQKFVKKLNELTGRQFRLPTEAEWEYAARGGSKSRSYCYSGSNAIKDVAWYEKNSKSTTHAVKNKQPNELGLYDMSGNVFEWCLDGYTEYRRDSQKDPFFIGSDEQKVVRGGGTQNVPSDCRITYRASSRSSFYNSNVGFRLAF